MTHLPASEHLTASELRRLALRTGRTPAAASGHLRGCEPCRTELRFLETIAEAGAPGPRDTEAAARAVRGGCPDPLVLARRVEGALPNEEGADLEAHLMACVPCSAVVDRLQHAERATGEVPVGTSEPAAHASSWLAKLRALVAFEMPGSIAISVRGGGGSGAGPFRDGMTAYRAARFDAARRHLESAAAEGGRGAELYLYLGACRLHDGDAASATEAWRLAVKASPRAGELQWYLAQALLQEGRADEALAALERSRRLPGSRKREAGLLAGRLRALLG